MIRVFFVGVFLFALATGHAQDTLRYRPSNRYFQYVGRIDFSNRDLPRFWAPGVYIKATFQGDECDVLINDEQRWGKHNYISLAVDDQSPQRIRLSDKSNIIKVTADPKKEKHNLTICKGTESGIGYVEFGGVICKKLLKPDALPARKIEFIGNSITCGTGSDQSHVKCGAGEWHDQHNAYLSYGPLTARSLHTQWTLTSVSGIGLTRSCCNLNITMPDVFDKVNQRENVMTWDFKKYLPDVVTICLGQNDGVQDSAVFCSAYIKFIGQVRKVYPKATIILLASPMADEVLLTAMKKYLDSVAWFAGKNGLADIHRFSFSKRFNSGCDDHPTLEEHKKMSEELADFIRRTKGW